MGKKLYPTDTLKQAQSILIAWTLIDPALAIGPVSAESLSADLTRVRALQAKIISLQNQLISLRNERDTACLEIYDKVKRARSGIKGFYGDDSKEYELSGGTRRSERKKPRRKAMVEVTDEPSEQP